MRFVLFVVSCLVFGAYCAVDCVFLPYVGLFCGYCVVCDRFGRSLFVVCCVLIAIWCLACMVGCVWLVVR